jgi:hypothetical protein
MPPARKRITEIEKLKKADLHVRTTASMGRVAPVEAVMLAKQKGIFGIAIVDHESVDGIPVAQLAGETYEVEVVPGVELTYEDAEREAHLLGYFIDWRNEELKAAMRMIQVWRNIRVEEILAKLGELGIRITYDEVMEEAGEMSVLGRTHVARLLVEKGHAGNVAEAFDKYLAPGRPAHVYKQQFTLKQLIDIIRGAGGVPALAHPKFSRARELIPQLAKLGLVGLEVYHPYHSPEETKKFQRIAKRYRLIEVGGTDSEAKRPPVGTVTVPFSTIEKLRRKIK